MLSGVVGWTTVRRTARVGGALMVIALCAWLATYPAFASEPKPPGFAYPPWVWVLVIVAASTFVAGLALHRRAARWRRDRLHLLAALEVRVVPGEPTAPDTRWVWVTDPVSGVTAVSSTERTVPANEQRALDMLIRQVER